MSRTAAPVGDVITPMRRGSARQLALARRVEQALGLQAGAQLLVLAREQAFARVLQHLDDELVVAPRLVQADAAARHELLAVLRTKPHRHVPGAEHRAPDLRVTVLQREVPVA